jgi:pyruvate kinase
MSKTKIVGTIGPASNTKKTLKALFNAGLNVTRLNFSHGTYEQHRGLIEKIRAAALENEQTVAIMADLQGPRIRVGNIEKKGRMLSVGQKVVLTAEQKKSSKKIPITYDNLANDVKVGQRILMVDGLISLTVKKISGVDVDCEVTAGGLIETHKGLNLPDTEISLASLTEKDREDVLFAVKNEVDYIAMSFTRSAKDVFDLRFLIKDCEARLKLKPTAPIRIVVKIERKEAIDNIEEIIEATDAVMIARGDLGIELPAEDVPLIQKMIIDKCLVKAKPVIVATQMLDSMIRNPRPTRAEVSDVANAVIDHADALMLSGETASGQYPVESVEYMKKIIEKTESSSYDDMVVKMYAKTIVTTDEAVSRVANILASSVSAKLILAASLSGYTARIISRYRPELPIYVVCDDERTARQLVLSWGVLPVVLPTCKSVEELIERSLSYLKKAKLVGKEDKIIIIAGEPVGKSGNVNLVEIKEIS